MDGRPQLQIDPDVTQVARAREFVSSVVEPQPVDDLFLVAFNEVVTNAIDEHRRVGSSAPVVITIDPAKKVVHVADQGRGYDPAGRATSATLSRRGRGLRIVESLTPGLQWRPNTPNGTVFTLPYPDETGASRRPPFLEL